MYESCIDITYSRPIGQICNTMRIIFVFLSFLFSTAAFSQIRVRNMGLKNPDSAILFRDLRNHIEISGIKDMSQYLVHWHGAYICIREVPGQGDIRPG